MVNLIQMDNINSALHPPGRTEDDEVRSPFRQATLPLAQTGVMPTWMQIAIGVVGVGILIFFVVMIKREEKNGVAAAPKQPPFEYASRPPPEVPVGY